MRPNLSVEKIAGALAVLGASVLVAACGGDKPAQTPVDAKEVAPSGEKAAGGDAAHCGAGKEHKAGEASCGAKPGDAPAADASKAAGDATKGAGDAAKGATDATKAAADTAKPGDKTPAPATTSTAKPGTPATTPPAKPGAAPAPKKAGGASCGAGTCSAKK